MSRVLSAIAALLLGAIVVPVPMLQAQAAHAAGLDLTVGLHGISGPTYKQQKAPILDALLAARLVKGERWSLVGAATAGVAAVGPSGDDCLLLSDGGCAPTHNLGTGSVLFGVARRLDANSTARLLVGPAAYRGRGETEWGVQVRGDLALLLSQHVGLGPMARVTLLPDQQGKRTTMWAVGVSLVFRGQ
jgi:hypothetical protein